MDGTGWSRTVYATLPSVGHGEDTFKRCAKFPEGFM
jgi:hypothetical protein